MDRENLTRCLDNGMKMMKEKIYPRPPRPVLVLLPVLLNPPLLPPALLLVGGGV